MALFVLTAKGPYALEVRIVRAKDLAEVERDFLPAIQCEPLFHTYKVKELLVDGETEEVFQIAHVE